MAVATLTPEVVEQIKTAAAEAAAQAVAQALAGAKMPAAVDQVAMPASGATMTVRQACDHLNLSRATLERLERSGKLVPRRFGRKVLYAQVDVAAFAASGGATR